MELDEHIKEYIDKVCQQIKCTEVHEDIKLELLDHIAEMSEDYTASGISREKAIEKAISQMGDAVSIGKQLDKSHKPKTEWSLLILTIAFASLGLFTVYLVEINLFQSHNSSYIFLKKNLLFNILGIVSAAFLYFFDYRKIQRYSKHIYIFTFLLLLLTVFKGYSVNGIRSWISLGIFNINFASICPYLFAVSLAGILDKWNCSSLKNITYYLALLSAPIIFITALNSLSNAVIYFSAVLSLTIVNGMKSKIKLVIPGLLVGSGIGLVTLFILSATYRMERFLTFIHPGRDPEGMGYIYIQLKKAISSAGLWGNGFTFTPKSIPEVQNDFIFSYIIYTFGWTAAAILVLLVAAYITRLIMAALVIKNNYGKNLIIGFTAILSTQFLWNILMILGFAPISQVSLPFISYGGIQLIMNMMALGLILSVYRRKDIARTAVEV